MVSCDVMFFSFVSYIFGSDVVFLKAKSLKLVFWVWRVCYFNGFSYVSEKVRFPQVHPWASLERPGCAPRVALEVWGAPWMSPGRPEYCYFVGFELFSVMSCFLMFFHSYLGAMSFSRKRRSVKGLYCFWEVKMLLFHWFSYIFRKTRFPQVRS